MGSEETIKYYEDILRRYNILNQIAKTVASTLDLNKLLRIVLTGVTFGNGFGFNRAFLFLIDREAKNLIGRMAIGPINEEEAWQIWSEIQDRSYSLEEFLNSEKFEESVKTSELDEKVKHITVPIEPGKVVSCCLDDGIPRNVDLTSQDNTSFIIDEGLIEKELIDLIEYPKFCIIPLISRTKKVGIMIVDNRFNRRDISQEDINYLLMLSQFVASSIRNTIIYSDLKESLSSLARLNMQLNYMKEYNEKIIESIPVSIIVIDNDFKVTLCNENCAKIMGNDKSVVVGKKISTHPIYMDSINLVDEIKRVIKEKKAEGFYKVNISIGKQKTEDVFDVVLVPLRFSGDSPEGVVLIIENITETVKLQKALNEMKKLSELGRLSATVAHEIRNPLIAIGGYANRFKKRIAEGKEIDLKNVDTIIDEIKRLEKIVSDILDYAAERKVVFERVDIGKILEECIEFARIAAERNNIDILIDGGELLIGQDKIFIYGSYGNLKQAFINIMNNAIEASSTRELVKLFVATEVIEGRTWLRIDINNSAALPDEKDVYNIFLPFYTTKIKGTGLGLTITKRIIEEHSGEIMVDSNDIKGTTFTIKLPLIN